MVWWPSTWCVGRDRVSPGPDTGDVRFVKFTALLWTTCLFLWNECIHFLLLLVSVRVLQRNRPRDDVCVCVCMCVGMCACLYCIYIHIKKFITRNQLTCCGGWESPKSAMGKLETQQNWQCGSGPKPDKLETHEKPVFQFEFKGRKNSVSQLKGSQVAGSSPYSWKGQTFVLFRLLTDWIRFTHIKKGNCFTQFTDSNINLVQKLRHI